MSVEQVFTNVDSKSAQNQFANADSLGVTIEPIDKTVLTALAEAQEDGEPDLIVELIDLYFQDAPQWVEAIRKATTDSDPIAMKRAAHTLKGSSGSIGVNQVAEICKMLEQLNGFDWRDRATSLMHLLVREFDRAREALLTERLRRAL